jgi:hypothetical protein
MKEPLIAIVTSKGWIKLPSLVVMCILFVYTGCATAKPCICPPAEVVTVTVPVPVPCPAPPDIPLPNLWLPSTSASGATVNEILAAVIHDYAELRQVEGELRKVLAVYATTPLPPPR